MSHQFTLLGKLKIEEDGRISELMKGPKTCALLVYLIITNEVHGREEIADLLWDSGTTTQSLTRLRTLLRRVKKSVPELKITRRTIAFEADENTVIDYRLFMTGLQSTVPKRMDKALQLYDDELLSGFYLPGASRFNEWLLMEREKLRYEVLTAYHKLSVFYEENKAWERGIAIAQRWLTLNALDEEALRWLMQFLALSGQVGVALTQYEHSRQQLWQELQVDPEPLTVELARKLSQLVEERGDGMRWERIVGAQAERPLPGQLAELGPLPQNAIVPHSRNQDFVGRREDLLKLADLLLPQAVAKEDASADVVAVTGMGGIGKTQLAVEFCFRYGRYFPGGVYWISFAQADNVVDEIATIGGERGLGLYQQSDKLTLQEQAAQVQTAWQEPIPRLLIFDNCEDEDLLAQWLPKSGGCRILLTSRRGDWAPERGVVQRPLSILHSVESMTFLRQLIPELTEIEAAEIAKEVGHLPLALHLSGSFLRRYRQMTPTNYLAQIRDKGLLQHPALQGRGTRYSPTGHELNVARTFALNLEQLDPTDKVDDLARQLLLRIACLAPGELIPQTLLQAIVHDLQTIEDDDMMAMLLFEDGLSRLIGLGFVEERGADSVVMHRLLVAFAKLEIGDVVAAQTAVAQAIIQELEAVWYPTTSYLGILPVAASHVQSVTDAALDHGSAQSGRLASLWGRHLMDVGNLQQARPYLERALALQEKTVTNEEELAETVQNLGTLMWKLNEMDAAWAYYERGMNIHKRVFGPNHLKSAHSLNNLGILSSRSGSFAEGQAYYEEALSIYEQSPEENQVAIARTLYNLGIMFNRMGDFVQAQSYHKRALVIREKSLAEDHPDFVADLTSLGILANQAGEYEKALSYKERAHRIRQKNLNPEDPSLAISLSSMGVTSVYLGAYEEALSYYQQALTIREKILAPDDFDIGNSYCNLGHLYLQMGEYETARTHLEKALKIQEAVKPDHESTGKTLSFLGDLHLLLGEPEVARPYLARALAIFEQRQNGHRVDEAHVLISLGEYYQTVGNDVEAEVLYERALAILQETAVIASHPDLQRVQKQLAWYK